MTTGAVIALVVVSLVLGAIIGWLARRDGLGATGTPTGDDARVTIEMVGELAKLARARDDAREQAARAADDAKHRVETVNSEALDRMLRDRGLGK